MAIRCRHRRALLFQLRADPCGRRNAPKSAVGRYQDRRRCFAGPGLLMAEVAIHQGGEGSPPLKIKPHWSRRAAGELATLVVALMILLSLGLVLLDTAPGHRWLVDRLGQVETASGLRFRIGRIEGSIFCESPLRQCPVLSCDG